jgi:hypothetical protein
MNSLQQSIERRRASEPAPLSCVDVSAQPTIVLSNWQSPSWVFPWSHLQSAFLSNDGDDEQLVLAFTHHRVTATGQNLRSIWDDVAAFRIGQIRNLPAQYRARVAPDAPFVRHINVEVIDGTKS